MGWGRTFLLGDIGNRLDIGDVERDVAQLKRRMATEAELASSREQQTAQLIRENAELKLYLAATVRLLIRKRLVTENEIAEMVAAIDDSDGRRDGQWGGPIV